MEKAKLIVTVDTPEGTAEPFWVTAHCLDCDRDETAILSPEGSAELLLPEGAYWLSIWSKAALSPRRQCKYLNAKAGQCYGLHAFFRDIPRSSSVMVNLTAVDAHYPNILPLTGGITIMAKESRTITFTNGVATGISLPVGTYTMTGCTIPGYQTATMEPITITSSTQTVTLRLTAAGTLTVSVVDDQAQPITAGALQFTNSTGTQTYGLPEQITNGHAIFDNVPYDGTGIGLYLTQNGSDTNHEPVVGRIPVTMNTQNETETIQNDRKSVTLTTEVTDAVYGNIVPMTGTVTLFG